MASSTLPLTLPLTLPPTALLALRLTPLLSTTATLTHAYMERITTSSFLGPAPVDSRLSRFLMGGDAPTALARSTSTSTSTAEEGESKREEGKPDAACKDGKEVAKERGNDEAMKEEVVEQAKEVVVPHWFTSFFNAGVWSVIGLNSITLVSASANLIITNSNGGGAAAGLGLGLNGTGVSMKTWYTVGLVAALSHYAFVPAVGRSVRALVCQAAKTTEGMSKERKGQAEGNGQEKAADLVKEWVWWHTVRMCTVDLVAWGCFVGAVGGSVGVVV